MLESQQKNISPQMERINGILKRDQYLYKFFKPKNDNIKSLGEIEKDIDLFFSYNYQDKENYIDIETIIKQTCFFTISDHFRGRNCVREDHLYLSQQVVHRFH